MTGAAKSDPALILCASLVENPLNLGGICRSAEALGVTTVMVPDLQVAQTWAFRQVAASAHRWQPLRACAPDHLSAWVRQQRSQGFTVLALTRSPTAEPLPEVQFSPRTVLLLGRELTGIPDSLRAVCDGAIAIPQWGQVESFNVHTAAAIAAYSYRLQYPV